MKTSLKLLLCSMLILSCGGDREQTMKMDKSKNQPSPRKVMATVLGSLNKKLAEEGGLVVHNVTVGADSISFVFGLTDEAVALWRTTAATLERSPVLTWATISAELSLSGKEPGRYQTRLRGLKSLGPDNPRIVKTLAKQPAKSSGKSPLKAVPEGAEIQCQIIAVGIR